MLRHALFATVVGLLSLVDHRSAVSFTAVSLYTDHCMLFVRTNLIGVFAGVEAEPENTRERGALETRGIFDTKSFVADLSENALYVRVAARSQMSDCYVDTGKQCAKAVRLQLV